MSWIHRSLVSNMLTTVSACTEPFSYRMSLSTLAAASAFSLVFSNTIVCRAFTLNSSFTYSIIRSVYSSFFMVLSPIMCVSYFGRCYRIPLSSIRYILHNIVLPSLQQILTQVPIVQEHALSKTCLLTW